MAGEEKSQRPLSPGEGAGGEMWRSLAAAQGQIRELQAQVSSLADTIEEQKDTIASLKSENDGLRRALASHDIPARESPGTALASSSPSPAVDNQDSE